jgi:hypothetical protein
MNPFNHTLFATVFVTTTLALTGCGGSSSSNDNSRDINTPANAFDFTVIQGTDLNSKASALLSQNPGGPGGSPNQSLRSGDVLSAEANTDSVIIGGLGVDILLGNSGNDILIGGTEDFNSNVDGDNQGADNRDRAFGNLGDDVFIWAPGDGSDFFDGGEGTDVLVFGVLGEAQDSDGSTEGAPFFNVNPPNRDGSQDFDGIFLDDNNLPTVNVSTSPGFCSVIAAADYPDEFALLDLDFVVRFTLRSIANDFDAGIRSDDDGLRVAVSAKNIEYLVCTSRDTGVEVLDLTTTPASVVDLSQLPDHIAKLIQ